MMSICKHTITWELQHMSCMSDNVMPSHQAVSLTRDISQDDLLLVWEGPLTTKVFAAMDACTA